VATTGRGRGGTAPRSRRSVRRVERRRARHCRSEVGRGYAGTRMAIAIAGAGRESSRRCREAVYAETRTRLGRRSVMNPSQPDRAIPDRLDVEALNDRFAREHPIDDYYAAAALPIRLIQRSRLRIIRAMTGNAVGLDLCEVGAGGGHVLRMFPQARLTAV